MQSIYNFDCHRSIYNLRQCRLFGMATAINRFEHMRAQVIDQRKLGGRLEMPPQVQKQSQRRKIP